TYLENRFNLRLRVEFSMDIAIVSDRCEESGDGVTFFTSIRWWIVGIEQIERSNNRQQFLSVLNLRKNVYFLLNLGFNPCKLISWCRVIQREQRGNIEIQIGGDRPKR